ncbi:TIGR01777 family protein [Fulvivirga sp. M361]|uniref:TIGR01777 family oxidoreductase n=1 Tax=Fulvivirga sp. M361 TaxID=2594266 RepID=UPI00117AD3D0|nr:TIGR01777 family oxidoreductase [Fulvivirga sp. M361]TRX61309.1 TIGR01777 family protein [Fulvivirga sp. M361]
MKKIIISGGTGFLGSSLINHFQGKEVELVLLTRQLRENFGNVRYCLWDAENPGVWRDELIRADAVINLNGRSVDCRYNEKNKQQIHHSRVAATNALGEAIQSCPEPPKVWINASSATIYRHSLEPAMTENEGALGTGFSVDVCCKWEAAFHAFKLPHTRKVIARIGIVLGKDGGAFIPLKRLARLGFGGRQGPGNQMISWLHVQDFCVIMDHMIRNDEMKGTYNLTAPNPLNNRTFMKLLRTKLRVPFGIPISKWLLEMGALVIGTETELILKSRNVIPQRLVEEGYSFLYKDLDAALDSLIGSKQDG